MSTASRTVETAFAGGENTNKFRLEEEAKCTELMHSWDGEVSFQNPFNRLTFESIQQKDKAKMLKGQTLGVGLFFPQANSLKKLIDCGKGES